MNTRVSALLKTLHAFGASLLMATLVASSFPVFALAQEPEVVVEPTVEETPADPAPVEEPIVEEETVETANLLVDVETNTPKVNICHRTESEQNPWNALRVDENGWGGHSGHGDDFLYGGPLKDGKPNNKDGQADQWCEDNAPEEPQGDASITVCKILVNEEDAVVTGADVDASFEFSWFDDETSQGSAEAVLSSHTFSTELDPNESILDSSDGLDDAECYTYENLEAGHYFYAEEEITGTDADRIEVVGYHDGLEGVADALEDFDAYSGELFDGDSENDDDRVQTRDGDINLGDGAHRTLVIVNRLLDEEVPPPQGDTCVIVSDTTNQVDGGNAALVQQPYHGAWTTVTNFFAGLGGGATWIWSTPTVQNPTQNETEVFTKTFSLTGVPSGATLEVSADNGYKVVVNASQLDDRLGIETNYSSNHNYAVSNLGAGNNTLEFTVKNFAQGGGTAQSNPAGLIYKLTVEGAKCGRPAEPEDPPVNSCILPGEGAGYIEWTDIESEASLQEILDEEVSGTDADDDQVNTQAWDGDDKTVYFSVENLEKLASNNHVFGYIVDDGAFVPVFKDTNSPVPAHPGAPALLEDAGMLAFSVSDVGDSIEFAIYDVPSATVFSTNKSNNTDGDDHAIVYNPSDDEYVIAFEDLPDAGDRDFNDLVVRLTVEDCDKGVTCDEGVELLENGGFETPAIEVADWDIVPSGTDGLAWLVEWITGDEDAPEPANAEFHKNVSGWDPHGGNQYAELDSDWNGHAPGPNGEAGAVVMSQTVDTVPGEEYTFTFWFSARPDTGAGENQAEVLVDGTVVYTTPEATGNGSNTAWTEHSVTFTAEEKTTTVAIRDADGNPNNSVGTFVDDASLKCAPEDDDEGTATVYADKVVCSAEQYLPNWGDGEDVVNITSETAQGWVNVQNAQAGRTVCWIEDWDFEWAPEGTDNVENENMSGPAGEPWTPFSGFVELTIPEESNGELFWFREILPDTDWLDFSGWLSNGENSPSLEDEYSAEFYCGNDVLNYDNYDYLSDVDDGETFYCVAFNVDTTPPQCSDNVDNVDGEDELIDSEDPGCHTDGDAGNSESYDPLDNDEGNSSVPTDSGRSRSRSGNHRGGGGEVLGASTCGPLLTQYLHIGWNNDASEVTKLQEFLNSHLGLVLPVTGFFGPATFAAVEQFQTQYGSSVLTPWVGRSDSGITSEFTPTGFVYQTTRWQINNIWCPGSEAFPETLI